MSDARLRAKQCSLCGISPSLAYQSSVQLTKSRRCDLGSIVDATLIGRYATGKDSRTAKARILKNEIEAG